MHTLSTADRDGAGVSRRAIGWVALAIVVAGAVGLFLAIAGDRAAAKWNPDDALGVTEVTVDAGGAPATVALAWPDPTAPAAEFQIRRGTTVIDTVAGSARTYVDAAPVAAETNYTVTARAAGGDTTGTLATTVRFPDPRTGCTLLWTGSASGDWDDAANWAPYGLAGATGAVRIPTATDHICVDQDRNFPITVDTPGANVDRVSALWVRGTTIEVVTGGDLKVFGPSTIPALKLSGGTVQLQDDTDLIWASGRDELTLGGGELMIEKTLRIVQAAGTTNIQGNVEVLPDTTTTIDGGQLIAQTFRMDSLGTTGLIGEGGAVLDATVNAYFNGTINLTTGTGGATLLTKFLQARGGDVAIDWAVGPTTNNPFGDPKVTVRNTTTLELADVVALGPTDDRWEDIDLDVRGKLVLAENLAIVGGSVELNSVDAELQTGGNPATLAQLVEAEVLELRGARTVSLPGDLTVNGLQLSDGVTLEIAGQLLRRDGDRDRIDIDRSKLVVGTRSRTAPETFVILGRDVEVEGDLDVAGDLFVGEVVDATGYSDVVFLDDLTLEPTSTVTVGADGDGAAESTNVSVRGTLTLDGELVVNLDATLPDGTNSPLFETDSPPEGDFDDVRIVDRDDTDGEDSTEGVDVEVDDDGIRLTSGGGGGGPGGGTCGRPPRVNDMEVNGCWVEQGRELWVASPELILTQVDLPRIGGLAFEPEAKVDLQLDLSGSSPTLLSVHRDRGDPDVRVFTRFTPADGAPETVELGAIPIDWVLDGRDLDVEPTDLLGAPIAGRPTVSTNSPWVLDVSVRLPGLLEALEVPFSLELAADAPAPSTDGLDVGIASLGVVAESIGLGYVREGTWSLDAPAGADGPTVEGTLDYDDGELTDGAVQLERVSPLGLGSLEPDLVYAPGSERWESRTVDVDGIPYLLYPELPSSTPAADSRIKIKQSADFGVFVLDELTYDTPTSDGWTFRAISRSEGVTRNVVGNSLVGKNALIPFSLDVKAEGKNVVRFSDIRLSNDRSYKPQAPLPPTTTRFVVEPVAGSAPVSGEILIDDGEVEEFEVTVPAAVGELADGEVTIRSEKDAGTYSVGGDAPGEPAVLDAGGEPVEVGGTLDIDDGTTTASSFTFPTLPLGLIDLDDVELTGAPGQPLDVAAQLDRQSVDGRLDLQAGVLQGGTLALPEFKLGEWFTVPEVSLVMVPERDSSVFRFDTPSKPQDLLKELRLVFADGQLVDGRLLLGDLIGGDDLNDAIASLRGLLPVGGLDVRYVESRGVWRVDGFLEQPLVTLEGELGISGGSFQSGFLAVDGARIGDLAEIDVALAVDGPASFLISGTVTSDAFSGDRTLSGSAEFGDGSMIAGSLMLGSFPIGEVATVENFSLVFADDVWSVDGTVVTDQGETGASGSAEFDEGALRAFSIEITNLSLGPLQFERFALSLDTASGANAYAVSGEVRGPNRTAARSAEAVEFTGSATFADGELIALGLDIPFLEVAGIAYVEDLVLSYSDDGARVTLDGAGQITSADEVQRTAATIGLELRDGRVTFARIATNRLSLGGLLVIEDLELIYDLETDIDCPGPDSERIAVYSLTGTLPDDSAISGCLSTRGRQLVGGALDAERLQVGELFTIENLAAEFRESEETTIDVRQPDGSIKQAQIMATTFDLEADVIAGELAPVSVDGELVLSDGGVAAFVLEVPRLPLSATVELVDLEIDYVDGARWDGLVDTRFAVSGTANHPGGTTSASGELEFRGTGALDAASLAVDDLPLGPFTIEDFTFEFQGGPLTQWLLAGTVTSPSSGQSAQARGNATIQNGRLVAATLDVPQLSVGELVLISNAQLSFDRRSGVERWFGTASVSGLDQANDPATATIEVVIAEDGSLQSGLIEVERVSWGGLIQVIDLSFSGARSGSGFTWAVSGKVQVGDGTESTLNGELVLADGVVQSGSLEIGSIRLDEWATIESIEVVARREADVTNWTGSAAVRTAEGGTTTGEAALTFSNGRLETASLEIGSVPVAELFTLDDLAIEFENGRRWAANGTITDEDGTSAVSGELEFRDAALVGGFLALSDFQFGPLEVASFRLEVDTTDTVGQSICGVADPGGSGSRYVVDATIASGDGTTASLGGRLRLDGGAFVEGVLCGDGIQVADMFVLDSVQLVYTTSGSAGARFVSFDGSAVVASQEEAGVDWSASVGFDIQNGQLQRFELTADGFRFAELFSLTGVSLNYDRTAATTWAFAATVNRPGPDSTISGSLSVDDGRIVGGSLQVGSITFGDLFTLSNLEIVFHGRRTITNVDTLPPFVSEGGTTECADTPADSNLPVGTGDLIGAESLFAVAATVEANGETFDATGSMSFAGGRMTTFDVTLACLPLGDFKTLTGIRVAARPAQVAGSPGYYMFGGRVQGDDGDSSGAGGELTFNNGRLTGGQLRMIDVPLGIVQLERFELALGQSTSGNTVYGLTIEIDDDGDTIGGGGSLTMNDGQLVAGAIGISRLPIIDLFTIEDLDISLDNSVPNRSSFSGGADVVLGGGGSAGMDIDLSFENGRLVAGAFAAEQVDLFSVIPLAGFSISYEPGTSGGGRGGGFGLGGGTPPSWSGSMQASLPGVGGNSGPGIVVGVEIIEGKLSSGVFGFDADGDGEADGLNASGAAPASGGGDFNGFPLKAMYLRYCAPDSDAAFCDPIDADTWEGRIALEFPTGSSPQTGLEASLRLRNGRFAAASLEVNGLSIPLYPGVFLNSVGAALELDPRFSIGGSMGLSVGLPSGFDILDINAALVVREMPDPDPNEDPDDYEPEWFQIYVDGEATLLSLPIQLYSFIDVQTNGQIGLGGGFDITLLDGKGILKDALYVRGDVDGYLFNASSPNLTLFDPRDEDQSSPLTGVGAQLRGSVAAGILGNDIVSASFVANTIGAAACAGVNVWIAEVSVGAGLYWDGGNKLTCDLGKFEITGLGSSVPEFANLTRAARSTDVATFTVPPGQPVLGVEVEGDGGEPDVELIDPDGQIFDLSDNDPDAGVIVTDGSGKRWFVIGSPAPGEWRVETRAGSLPIADVSVSIKLPDVDVAGTVALGTGGVTVDWTATSQPGQQIVVIERALDGEDFTAVVGSGDQGLVTFFPGGAASQAGTTREVVAQVTQDGFLREEVVLGTFVVPAATLPSAPTALVVTETAAGAQISWQPPSSTGGRAILGYQVTSTAGWSVNVPAEQLSAHLPIPGMTPGEEVPVFVQVRTGVGLGEAAAASFVSNQTTGFQYAASDPIVTDNLGVDTTAPTVTIEQAAGQDDPTAGTPIAFDVTFSEAVTGFEAADVIIGGTAGPTTATVVGGGGNYTVLVAGMPNDGTVTASVAPGAAVDPSGNPSAASTSVDNVVDFEILVAPMRLAVADDVRVQNDPGAATATVEYSPAVALGGQAPAVVSCFPASGSAFPIGTTRVECTATDAGQGVDQQQVVGSFDVIVEDTEAPTLSPIGDVAASSSNGAPVNVTFATPTAGDNSGVAPTVRCAPPSGSAFAVGTTTVTCTATDAAGNTATTTFEVMVAAAALPATGGGSATPIIITSGVALVLIGLLLVVGGRRRRLNTS